MLSLSGRRDRKKQRENVVGDKLAVGPFSSFFLKILTVNRNLDVVTTATARWRWRFVLVGSGKPIFWGVPLFFFFPLFTIRVRCLPGLSVLFLVGSSCVARHFPKVESTFAVLPLPHSPPVVCIF